MSFNLVWGPTHRRAIKKICKVVNEILGGRAIQFSRNLFYVRPQLFGICAFRAYAYYVTIGISL